MLALPETGPGPGPAGPKIAKRLMQSTFKLTVGLQRIRCDTVSAASGGARALAGSHNEGAAQSQARLNYVASV